MKFGLAVNTKLEEAFASPRVTVQQCYAIHRAMRYILKELLNWNLLKRKLKSWMKNPCLRCPDKKNTILGASDVAMDETISKNMCSDGNPPARFSADFGSRFKTLKTSEHLIRSAHFFGVKMVLMPKDHTSPITDVVSRASAGAVFSIPIVRATNLVREINKLKDLGLYMISLSPESREPLHTKDFKNDAGWLVIGSEGSGVRRLVEETCDFQMLSYKTKAETA
jgi:hypothetical protein